MLWYKWIRKIQRATEDMDGTQTAEYIAEYYWYHILLTFLGIGLFVLIVYHVTAGGRNLSLACVIVNERADQERDRALREEIAQALDLEEETVRVDSEYHISYPGHAEQGNNESDYEKFFFGWSQGELDVVILPESFLRYCKSLGGEIRTLAEDGTDCIPLRQTVFAGKIEDPSADPMMVIFPADGEHTEETGRLCAYLLTGGGEAS